MRDPLYGLIALAVIARAVRDLDDRKQRHLAKAFLTGEDGREWCELAGLDYNCIQRVVSERAAKVRVICHL